MKMADELDTVFCKNAKFARGVRRQVLCLHVTSTVLDLERSRNDPSCRT